MASGLDDEVIAARNELGDDAELILQSHAPKGKGGGTRLARSIHTRASGEGNLEVVADARNPQSGYMYVGVTRFGHRKAEIKPVRRGFAASVVSTQKRRAKGKRAALRIVLPSGLVIFRNKVKAYRPDHDWAESAFPEIQAEARAVATRLGQRIITRFRSS